MVTYLSNCLIPILFFIIVCYGWKQKKDIYQEFLKGAKEGFHIVFDIAPTLIGLFMAVSMFRTSGAMDLLVKILEPVGAFIKMPIEIIPVIAAKLFSSSAATGILLDLFKQYGADSQVGLIASLILSSTETVFYTMSVYFMYVDVKKTRWTLPGALFCTLAGVLASLWIGSFLFS
ncbi:MAG: spore maturation protein [Lachnospiraceae bacterium]|nr:spore maturation protein [Lachnospiraceae bacterium]